MPNNRGVVVIGVLFLLAAIIVGVSVITNKNFTFNPGKRADVYYYYPTPTPTPTSTPIPTPVISCIGACYSTSCSELGFGNATGICPNSQYCCYTKTPSPKPPPIRL